MQRKEITPDKALARCEALCARSEQSSGDIELKLVKWGLTKEQAGSVLQRLIDGKYVDDARFARAYVREKFRFSGWGRVKIAYNLRLKHIDNDIVTEAMDEIDASLPLPPVTETPSEEVEDEEEDEFEKEDAEFEDEDFEPTLEDMEGDEF